MESSANANNKEVFQWPPLESDPEIFNNYLHKLGLSEGYIFGELFGLDEEMFCMVEGTPVSIIVNYERAENKKTYKDDDKLDSSKVPFYMLQQGSLDNACGVIAALHSIGNNKIELNTGSILERFYKEAAGKTPKEICSLLENMTDFKEAHKSYSQEGQSRTCDEQSQVKNHFVCFTQVGDQLVEFDGVLGTPVIIDKGLKEGDLLSKSAAEIKRRLQEKNITENLSVIYLAKA